MKPAVMSSLYVSESGTSGAESIVFLHGIGTSGWMWDMQTKALDDYHTLNPDLPGHGKSSDVQWESLADTTDQIAAIIRSRATNGKAHVVGLSLGGYIALDLLERHTDVADRVVISGVTAEPMPNRIFLRPQLWLMTRLLKQRWFVNMQAKAYPLSPQAREDFTENLLAMSMDAYRRVYEELVDFRVSSAFRAVHVPTLVTAGGRESEIIKQAVEVIPKVMPNAQGCFAPGLGHGWNVEAPALFSAMIRAWISGTPLPARLQAASP